MQRHRFINDLRLLVPVDLFRYCPRGSHTTVLCIVQVEGNRCEKDRLTQTARIMAEIKPKFHEFHTWQMKQDFKNKMQSISDISLSAVELIDKELSLDQSASEQPEMLKRLKLIFLGESGLLPDLCKLNPVFAFIFKQEDSEMFNLSNLKIGFGMKAICLKLIGE